VDYRLEFRVTACSACGVGTAVPADVYQSIRQRMGRRHIVEAKEPKSWDLCVGRLQEEPGRDILRIRFGSLYIVAQDTDMVYSIQSDSEYC